MNRKRALLLRREAIVEQLPPFSEVVRGSLSERHLRCGKPSCHCAKPRGEPHTAFYLSVSFGRGRTEQITVPRELVPEVQRWLDNYQRWWAGLEAISAINRDLLRKRWIGSRRPKRQQG